MKYTVIIPHYNSYEKLVRLLGSIPQRDDLEVIVVDDLSDDRSIESLAASNEAENVHFHLSEQKLTAGGARNLGLEQAQGTWLLFADADDFFLPQAFEKVDQAVKTYGNALVIDFKKHKTPIGSESYKAFREKRLELYDKKFGQVLKNKKAFNQYRYTSYTPWSKAFNKHFIDQSAIQFVEVIRANDIWFVGKAVELAKEHYHLVEDCIYSYETKSSGSLSTETGAQAELSRVQQYAHLWKNQKGNIRKYSNHKKIRIWRRAIEITDKQIRSEAIQSLKEAGVFEDIFFATLAQKLLSAVGLLKKGNRRWEEA